MFTQTTLTIDSFDQKLSDASERNFTCTRGEKGARGNEIKRQKKLIGEKGEKEEGAR